MLTWLGVGLMIVGFLIYLALAGLSVPAGAVVDGAASSAGGGCCSGEIWSRVGRPVVRRPSGSRPCCCG